MSDAMDKQQEQEQQDDKTIARRSDGLIAACLRQCLSPANEDCVRLDDIVIGRAVR